MAPDLGTTNTLLGIMAFVSVLEALVLIALLAGGFLLYRQTARLIAGIEERQIAPVAARVTAILDDVKGVSGAVRAASDVADSSVRWGLAWLLRRARRSTRS
jgi:hypothetical protein